MYDLKDFEARHPGGDVIRLSMARDASILYESYHPASSAARLAPYKVGTCADAPQVSNRAGLKSSTSLSSRSM